VNAFCCVAPGVRFSDFAILATGIFWRARVFSSRTSSLVHSRRFAFFAIFTGSDVLGVLAQHYPVRQAFSFRRQTASSVVNLNDEMLLSQK
jgi:hypothetical protein